MDRFFSNAQMASVKDAPKFDLLLFDLDHTLVESGSLEQFRGFGNVGNRSEEYVSDLRGRARQLTCLIPEAILLRIRRSYPGLRLGVLTSAPQMYARILLEHCFPNVQWDCLVAFEDLPAGGSKPDPTGVFCAARAAGVDVLSRVALVGDDAGDLIAAYQAGAHAILFTSGWGEWNCSSKAERNKHLRARDLMPDAELSNPLDLLDLISQNRMFLPALEAWVKGVRDPHAPMRVQSKRYFNDEPDAPAPKWVEGYSMGRYFSSKRYDYQRRQREDCLRTGILAAKDGTPYPDAWLDCCAAYILQYSKQVGPRLLVCTVPPGSAVGDGCDRLVDLVQRIWDRLHEHRNIILKCDVLKYTGGTRQNKTLDKSARFKNVRDHLEIDDNRFVKNLAVLVLDDVVTTGATFFYATQILRQQGAISVRCLALARTIS